MLAYEIEQKGRSEEFIWENIAKAYDVMKDTVQTGLTENMQSRLGMVNNSTKKGGKGPRYGAVAGVPDTGVTGAEAKEVNSGIGRMVEVPSPATCETPLLFPLHK